MKLVHVMDAVSVCTAAVILVRKSANVIGSSFQRLSKTKNTAPSSQETISSSQNENNITIDDDFTSSDFGFHTEKSIDFQDENNKKNEDSLKEISFTFIVKKADGKLLPGKWLTLDVLTFEKFVIQIQRYVGSMVGIDDIDQTEYSLAFKPAKSNGEGLELSESKDFEKFLNEYEKLFKSKKEIIVIAKMKAMKQKLNKKKKRKQIEEEILESDDSDNSSLNENMSKKKSQFCS
ncbi:unnamed protein product [Rhizophagus irregularis]|nr:unnamed protein product [Rhizophagus irregularis]